MRAAGNGMRASGWVRARGATLLRVLIVVVFLIVWQVLASAGVLNTRFTSTPIDVLETIAGLGGDVSPFVPPAVATFLDTGARGL